MSEPRTRIFISHASKGDKKSASYRDLYCRELGKRFDVLVDLRLGEGEWRQDLFKDMLRAHAAIILLGERAPSDSPWLACEAFLFRIRKELDPDFKIFPVRLPSVLQEEVLRSRWLEPAGLGELTIYSSEDALSRIQEEIAQLTPSDLYPAEIERFVEHMLRVVDHRKNGGLCPKAFERAHDEMGLRVGPALLPLLRDSLIYQFTRHPLPKSLAALRELPLSKVERHEAVRLIAPLWITYTAACRICSYVQTDQDKRAFSVNTGQNYEAAAEYTANWYIRRGFGQPFVEDCCKVITLEAHSPLSANLLFGSIEQKLVQSLRLDSSRDLKPQIQQYFQRGRSPVIVVLPEFSGDDAALISELNHRFPGVTWMYLVSDATCVSNTRFDDKAPLLRPLLDPCVEYEAIEAYQDQLNELTPEIRRPHVL